MTQSTPPRPALADTPWQACPGLRASAIDGAAALIVMEVLLDAFAQLPRGRAALAAARARRAGTSLGEAFEESPTEAAADALASALIAAAGGLDDDRRFAA